MNIPTQLGSSIYCSVFGCQLLNSLLAGHIDPISVTYKKCHAAVSRKIFKKSKYYILQYFYVNTILFG